ncbi:heme-binding protein 1-like [Acanthaster planci]|uniref:Heme-binding protein 1 n=1 Tax=Acanthaster planci TaxID=133434 RepID=A0A8B7Z0Y7_ACAPL|nr:heme-binding protein 1-like [Acanthaster planci]
MFTKTEGPKYTVISSSKDFEERQYEPCMWAVIDSKADTIKEATSAGFQKLFKYISGTNKEGLSMSMTAPVMVYHEPGEVGSWKSFKKEIKVGFMIPDEHREKPPSPNDDMPITIRQTPSTRVYARKYGGFSKEEVALAEVAKLGEALGTEHKYKTGFCYFCGYDSPMKVIGRRNEIWFIKDTTEGS